MKTSALTAALVAVVTVFAWAGSSPSENARCREIGRTDLTIAADLRIAQDLLSGTWFSANGDQYEFAENGTLAIFQKNSDGNLTVRSTCWKAGIVDGLTTLKIGEETFRAVQTCEGIGLTNLATNGAFSLGFAPAAMPGHASKVRSFLTGDWTNVTVLENDGECGNISGGFLSYAFGADGAYRCNYGSQEAKYAEQGTWSVSKDGQFLLLDAGRDGTSVVLITGLDGHGMVLESVMQTDPIRAFFCTEVRSFTFIK